MTRFLMLPLAVPLACLALLSLVAFLGVVALAGALRLVGAFKSGYASLGEMQQKAIRGTAWWATLIR
jgi:hypothetical protein